MRSLHPVRRSYHRCGLAGALAEETAVPDPETDVELPIEHAVEQEQDVEAGQESPAPTAADPAVLEADVADQKSVGDYGEDDYR
jgi:hypothetical protein